MLPRAHRLKLEKDFKEVLRQRKGHREDGLFLKTKKGTPGVLRFGIVVGKSAAAKATRRNRIRRLLSAAIEKRLKEIKEGADCVLLVLPHAKLEKLKETQELVDKLLFKASLTKS